MQNFDQYPKIIRKHKKSFSETKLAAMNEESKSHYNLFTPKIPDEIANFFINNDTNSNTGEKKNT